MNERLMRERYTKIAIPKGELLNDFLRFLTLMECEPKQVDQSRLVYGFPQLALPVLMVANRAREVGKVVADPTSEVSFGFTGSDVVWEQQLNAIDQLPSDVQQQPGRLAVGFTPNLMEKVAKPKLESLSNLPGAKVITPYPNITRQVLQGRGVEAQTMELQGATESYWWGDSLCMAILDVVVSGSTFRENNIYEAETVLDPVVVNLVTAPESVVFSQAKAEQRQLDAQVVEDLFKRIRAKREFQRRRNDK